MDCFCSYFWGTVNGFSCIGVWTPWTAFLSSCSLFSMFICSIFMQLCIVSYCSLHPFKLYIDSFSTQWYFVYFLLRCASKTDSIEANKLFLGRWAKKLFWWWCWDCFWFVLMRWWLPDVGIVRPAHWIEF